MKNITIISIIKILLTAKTLYSQNENDALLFSQQQVFGSAKYMSMGGAFNALGGDFATTSHNPSGLAFYQNNEILLSSSFYLNNSTSYFDNLSNDHYHSGFNISNLGIVLSNNNINNKSNWKRVNFAIGWNKLADYNQNIRIEGYNYQNSLVDYILSNAQGKNIENLDPFFTLPAFNTYLIDSLSSNQYFANISPNSVKFQEHLAISSGSQNEFVISLASSYNEKIYLGATIGFPIINYYHRIQHTENNFSDTINNLEEFQYEEELSVYGNGLNIKAGAIMRLSEKTKIGISAHSPTIFNIKDNYNTFITTKFKDYVYESASPYNIFNYELITPWKSIFGLSSTPYKNILISADYEIIDYSFLKMHSDYYSLTHENNNIKDAFKKTHNIKIGNEIRIKPFSLRMGYNYFGSPYKENDFSTESYSFGASINSGGYFIDLTYVLTQQGNIYTIYEDNSLPIQITNHNFVCSLGFRY